MNKRTTRILTGFAVFFTLAFGASADAYASRNDIFRNDDTRANFKTQDFTTTDVRFNVEDVRFGVEDARSNRNDVGFAESDRRDRGSLDVRVERDRNDADRYSDRGQDSVRVFDFDAGRNYDKNDLSARDGRDDKELRLRPDTSFARADWNIRNDGDSDLRLDGRAKDSGYDASIRPDGDIDNGKLDAGKDRVADYRLDPIR